MHTFEKSSCTSNTTLYIKLRIPPLSFSLLLIRRQMFCLLFWAFETTSKHETPRNSNGFRQSKSDRCDCRNLIAISESKNFDVIAGEFEKEVTVNHTGGWGALCCPVVVSTCLSFFCFRRRMTKMRMVPRARRQRRQTAARRARPPSKTTRPKSEHGFKTRRTFVPICS